MRIPDEVLQAVRSRVSIVDVVERHVALKRAGKNWVGLCPFHSERTPSFVVSEERGTYHCFGCGAGGTVFRFLMEIRSEPFADVVRSLAKEAGVPFDQGAESAQDSTERRERGLLLEVLSAAARYYRHQLVEGRSGKRARDYLAKREIPAAAAECFGLGCAPPGWDNLVRYLEKKGVDLDVAARAGLVAERSSGGHYDRLRDRLVFPIRDAAGRVVSLGGRVVGQGEPKYLNGPETAVFHKSQLLYGMYEGRDELRRKGRAILVEGYLDVISLHARGFGSALATLGTSLTGEHVRALRRRVGDAILLYDGDDAGRKAAFRSLDLFLAEGFPCSGVLLPPEHDPDSFVRGGGDLEGLLKTAKPLFELFLEDRASRGDLRTADGKLSAAEEIVPRLAAVSDPLAQGLYSQRAAEVLGIEEARLKSRVRLWRTPGRRRDRPPEVSETRQMADPLERALLESLVFEPDHRPVFLSRGIETWMRDAPLREAARFVAEREEEAGSLPVDEAAEAARRALTEILVGDRRPPVRYAVLEARLRLRDLEGRASQITAEIRRAEMRGDDETMLGLLREKAELDKALLSCRRAAGSAVG